MRFVVLSHAGLLVEHAGIRLVCDPWLLGSCYWRSWWNFPEPDASLIQNLQPHYIYITHLHWDHFHGPSLRKLFSRDTTVLVPKLATRRMVDDLHWLKFHRIVEIPHGTKLRLGGDFDIWSYQFGVGVDSAAVMVGGGHTLFNCNDAKFFGLPLRQILRKHSKIDFVFRSHSSASPVPYCIENYQRYITTGDPNYDSADQFARFSIFSGARYAIPFASNHCFLHPETQSFNATASTPDLAHQRYADLAEEVRAATACVVMPPGSSWDDGRGFDILPFDFSKRDEYVRAMGERHAATIARQIAMEAQTIADFGAFKQYFDRFLRAMPAWLRRWVMAPAIFRVRDLSGVHYWYIDPRSKTVSARPEAPSDTVQFEVPAVVINDCTKLRMFSVWSASKRLRILLPSKEGLAAINLWFTLLDLYELDFFPLLNNLSWRSIAVRLRRWREPVQVVILLLRRVLLRERFSVARIYPLERPQPRA